MQGHYLLPPKNLSFGLVGSPQSINDKPQIKKAGKKCNQSQARHKYWFRPSIAKNLAKPKKGELLPIKLSRNQLYRCPGANKALIFSLWLSHNSNNRAAFPPKTCSSSGSVRRLSSRTLFSRRACPNRGQSLAHRILFTPAISQTARNIPKR